MVLDKLPPDKQLSKQFSLVSLSFLLLPLPVLFPTAIFMRPSSPCVGKPTAGRAVPNKESRGISRDQHPRAQRWRSALHDCWLSYVQLCRLNPPISWFLVFLPGLFGALHAATRLRSPAALLLRVVAVLLAHSFFISNAGVAWNDLIDAPIDARVARTKHRPVACGAISPRAASLFVYTQAILAAACLLPLPRAAAISMVPAAAATMYYPFAKRHIPAPQLVIGFCMGWSVLFGVLAMGYDAGHAADRSTMSLMMATAMWTVLCDTVYAHQDLADDERIGVKSLAVLVRGHAKTVLWLLLVAMIALLYYIDCHADGQMAYKLISVAGCSLFAGTMLTAVNLNSPASCSKWAGTSFGSIGFLIASGLLARYLA